MYQRIDLGDIGKAFLTNQLRNGGALSRLLISERSLLNCYTLGDETLNASALTNFESSNGQSLDASLRWLEGHAQEIFAGSTSYSFIVEDPWLRPSDVSQFDDAAIVKNTILYTSEQAGGRAIGLVELARSPGSFQLLGFLIGAKSRVDKKLMLLDGQVITTMAPRVPNIIIAFASAYDRDGLVIGELGR